MHDFQLTFPLPVLPSATAAEIRISLFQSCHDKYDNLLATSFILLRYNRMK